MTPLRRLIGLATFVVAMASFIAMPRWLGLDANGLLLRAAVVQVGGPLLAAICCFIAAWRSPKDRMAWSLFGVASALYFAGNLTYLVFAINGIDPGFPSVAEASFLLMAPIFALGMFAYARVRRRLSRTTLASFLLIYCAVTVATLVMLEHTIQSSPLSPLGTVVAVLYPSLWFSVAASCALALVLYNLGGRTFAYALLTLAVSAEALADVIYSIALLNGTYVQGGLTEFLWVASTGLIVWAAFVQMGYARISKRVLLTLPNHIRKSIQAAIPVAAIALALLADTLSDPGINDYYTVSVVLVVVAFAGVAGLREYWIGREQRKLRITVENGRGRLAQSEGQLSAVLQSTTDSILLVDRDWRIEFINGHARRMLAPNPNLDEGVNLWDAFPEMKGSLSYRMYHQAMISQQPVEFEEHYGGMWIDIHAFPTHNGGLSIFFRDVSEARRAREEVLFLAMHDQLTGLGSRAWFHQHLSGSFENGEYCGVVLLDLDHFKEINDSIGHEVGDAVLKTTAERLSAGAPQGSVIARLGGDEFAIFIPGETRAANVKHLAQRLIDSVSAPQDIERQTIVVGASAGVAVRNDGDERDDDVLKRADIALWVTKGDTRGRSRAFEPAMQDGLHHRQALRTDMAEALERKEFEVFYQPIVDLRTGRASSFEALLRWRHPVHGMIQPDVFIPIAEESGLIVKIGEWVLKTACKQAAGWPGGVSVGINLSTRQFGTGDLVGHVKAALRASKLPSGRLDLEITELVLLKDSRANFDLLRRLRDLGARIVLDDFGTGYSSLSYLQRFPFNKIKIDRSFISGLPASDESQAIVRAISGLGRSLGMKVTAEGVETQEQYEWLKTGCDEAQGYLMSRPVPAGDIPALIERLGVVDPEPGHAETRRLAS